MQYIQIQPQDSSTVITPGSGNVNFFIDSTTNEFKIKSSDGSIMTINKNIYASETIPLAIFNKTPNALWRNTFTGDLHIVDSFRELFITGPGTYAANGSSYFDTYQNIVFKLNLPTGCNIRNYTAVGALFSYMYNDANSYLNSSPAIPFFSGQTYFIMPDNSGEVKVVINFLIDLLKTYAKFFDSTLSYTAPIGDTLTYLTNFRNDFSSLFDSGGLYELGVHSNRLARVLLLIVDFLNYYKQEGGIIEFAPSYTEYNVGDNSTVLSTTTSFFSFFTSYFS